MYIVCYIIPTDILSLLYIVILSKAQGCSLKKLPASDKISNSFFPHHSNLDKFTTGCHWLSSRRNTYLVNRKTFSSPSPTSRTSRKIRKKTLKIKMTAMMTSQKRWRRRWSRRRRAQGTVWTTSSLRQSMWCYPPLPSLPGRPGRECRGPTPARCSPQTLTTMPMNIVLLKQKPSCQLKALVTNQVLFLNKNQQVKLYEIFILIFFAWRIL